MAKMSSANLIVLGLLLDKPMSAYKIAQIIENQVIGQMVKISSPTVYKNIKLLEKEGYLSMERVKEGEMPEKKVYTVTEEGKGYFFTLMEHYSRHFERPVYEYDAFLVNLDKVDKATGLKQLQNMREHFYVTKQWIYQHYEEAQKSAVFFAGKAIIKRYKMMFAMLTEWIDDTIDEYQHVKEMGKYSTEDRASKQKPEI